MEELRRRIDGIDDRILELLESRVELAKKIGAVKRGEGLPVHNPEREEDILERLTAETKLEKDFVREIFESIITYCRENE